MPKQEYLIRYESTNGDTDIPEQMTNLFAESAEQAEQEFRSWFTKEYEFYTITRLSCEAIPFEAYGI